MSSSNSYKKTWKSHQEQIQLLQSRGMIIANTDAAIDFLRHIGYYRFSGFCLAFESSRHQFLPGITFEDVQVAYNFDCDLRDLVTEALEIVELDFRSSVAHHFGQKHGPFGHTEPRNFISKFHRYQAWMGRLQKEADRSNELFAKHFKENYCEFPNLPIWVINEIMSFGAMSQMCKYMHKEDQKALAHQYRLQPKVFASWTHHLVYVRNLCAHHSRLWDRIWSIKPKLPHGCHWMPPYLPDNHRLFSTLLILSHIAKHCPAVTGYMQQWKLRVEKKLEQSPSVLKNANELMGLTAEWKINPIWK